MRAGCAPISYWPPLSACARSRPARTGITQEKYAMKALTSLGVVVLVLLAGCSMLGGGKDAGPAVITSQNLDRIQGRQWELKKLTIDGRDIVMDLDANMTLTFGADGKA